MDVVPLRSGREIVIRPIAPGDGEALQAAYDRLSPQTKYARFLAPKPHLSRSETDYLVHVDGHDHVALVATRPDDPDFILGVARFVRADDDRRVAEFAVVVGDAFQHEGVGTELLERLAARAVAVGITRFRATTLAENVAAHRLLERLSWRLAAARHDGPVDELELELAC